MCAQLHLNQATKLSLSMSEKDKPKTIEPGKAQKGAETLSQKIPHLLVHLAKEPSLGLHFVCAHAKTRAVPTLVQLRTTLRKRTVEAGDMALDAKFTADSLRTDLGPAIASLRKLTDIVAETRALLADAGRDDVPVVSAQ